MSSPEPIAIIGLACRFPGGADTPEKLWDIVSTGRQCWSEVPDTRYNWPAFHHPDPDFEGTHNARGGYFLNQNIAAFDPSFFGIPAAEAAAIDPQQRLLLEVSYEALESSGLSLQSIKGSNMGVYVALVSRDYDRQIYKDPGQIPKHHLTGCGDATACGRISYVFDLRGPCVSLDTGCSGGMVALHLACQALRLGETDKAIVGGTNLLLGPDMTVAMSALHMINEDGRCYPFDSRGAGYGRAEGVAALVVKRMKDALRDGDPIRAVIRHTGVNQDGKTNGILLPSSEAQRHLAASLYRQVGLNPLDVCYVEAHGTGTQAGDVAEVTSVKQVFAGEVGRRGSPLFLGSIKANIGHSESTSGLAGVIKTVMALEKAVIPPLAGLETIKSELEPRPWPHGGTRLASVNSFGFGGTNAHAILESSPLFYSVGSDTCSSPTTGSWTPSNGSADETLPTPNDEERPLLFVVSAKTKTSLQKTIQNVLDWVLRHGTTYVKRLELANTLSLRRSLFKWRTSITAFSYGALLSALDSPHLRLSKSAANPRVVFVFTGQGSQYAKMGRELLYQEASFSHSLYRSRNILTDLGASWDLIDELLSVDSASRINSSELSQPATTAIQIALVDMLTQLNVHPTAVLGHSSGEVAAAYAAGILDHKEALTIAYYKGFVASWCKEAVLPKGAMLAVGLGEEQTLKYLERGQSGKCTIACVNSPSSVTLSGDETAVMETHELLEKDSVFNRQLKVDIAYHSHHMRAVSGQFYDCIQHVRALLPRPSVSFFSSVTGSRMNKPLGASYWVDNLVSQVRFSPALEALAREHFASSSDALLLVEVGPHAALQGPIRQVMHALADSSAKWLYTPSLVRKKDAHVAALEMIGSLFEQGVPVDLTIALSQPNYEAPQQLLPVVTDLSPYPWDHSSHYWHESRLSKEYRFRQHPPHDLCGLRLSGTSVLEPCFRQVLSVENLPWLQEHIIDGFALYPGSAFLTMGIEALRQVCKDRGEKREIAEYVFRDVVFSRALVVPDSPGRIEVLLNLSPSRSPWEEFRITSVDADGTWNEHCKGFICALFRTMPTENEVENQAMSVSMAKTRLDEATHSCHETIPREAIYAHMRDNGIDYGDSFAIIQDLQLGDHKAIGRLQIPDIRRVMPFQHMQPHVIHPAVFDAFMHIALPLYHRHCSQGPVMLTSVGEVKISADIVNNPGVQLVVMCQLTQAGRRHGSVEVSIFQYDALQNLVQVGSLEREDFRAIGEGNPGRTSVALSDMPPSCYQLDLVPISWPDSRSCERQGGSHRFTIYSLSETPIALQLVEDMLSYMSISPDGSDVGIVPCREKMMDPAAIHIVFVDGLSAPLASVEFLTLLSQLQSILLVTISSGTVSSAPGISAAGLARVAQQEREGLNIITLDYQDDPSSDKLALYKTLTEILHRSFIDPNRGENPVDREYLYRHGRLLVPRFELNSPANKWLTARANGSPIEITATFHNTEHAMELYFQTPGLLDSAVFLPIQDIPGPLEPDEVLVKVYAHGVNSSDISVALDRAEPTETMMGELAGTVVAVGALCHDIYKPGDRVCGWGLKPYTNTARVKRHLVHHLDESISFTEGASIPVAFQTAMYALGTIAGLEKAQTVLINGAAKEVGQAAISIAKYIGAEIYATVGSREEEKLLIDQAGIPQTRIFSGRSAAFKDAILDMTNGQGVDVILNCSSGVFIDEIVPCLADLGYVVDVARSKTPQPQAVSQRFGRNVTFASIDMQLLATRRPKQVEGLMTKVMALYHAGKLRPIAPLTAMSLADLGNAFRLVQSQRYSGKIVLESDDTVSVKQLAPEPRPPVLAHEGTYAVIGGCFGLNHALCTFLEARGAGHILSVVSSHAGTEREDLDSSRFQRIKLDEIWNENDILSALSSNGGVNLRGILHVECKPELCALMQRIDEELQSSTDKMHRVEAAIAQAAANGVCDFCITLASCAGLLESQGHAIYAAGSSLDSQIAPHCVKLRLGAIEGVENWEYNGTGTSYLKPAEVYNILDYCITAAARQDNSCSELYTGFDTATIPRANPIFGAIRETADEAGVGQTEPSAKKNEIDQQIASAGSMAEVHGIVLQAATQQLSSFLAIDADDINKESSIASLGLDSLLAIEFKNWLVRTTQAPVQTSEVLDASSLSQLVGLVIQRSKLVRKENDTQSVVALRPKPKSIPPETPPQSHISPPLPIPDLKSLIDRHLSYLRAHATDQEFQTTLRLAAEFQAPGSIGRRLYDRLKALKTSNPETWYHDLYLRNQYLVRNGPLAPYMSFFFTHPVESSHSHSQAERAALVVATVIRYKDQLDRGQIQPRIVNEEPLCMDLYKYLFNTSREPTEGIDILRRYAGNEYFVVLRRGHVYKVGFDQHSALEGIFETILQRVDANEVDWLGILTADDRISWAKARQTFMDLSQENAAYIRTIEKSAFVVCLDDGSPETAEERGRHFHFADGSNRWHDRSIQFIIAANGVSGILGDHTALDAATVHELNMEIADAIQRDSPRAHGERALPADVVIEQVKYSTTPLAIQARIQEVRRAYATAIASREHRYPPPLPYGSSLMKRHRIPANSAFQLVVQLAGRYYFGHISPCWETVLQSNFRTGRVEINQVVSEQVAAFVDVAANNKSPLAECRKRFVEAARTHSASVLACTRAGGSDRFLSMLREIVQEGEEVPGLYLDPVYKTTRPRKFISNCFGTGMAENGCCLRDEEGIWLHFEVGEEGVKFSIVGPAGQTERFCDGLVRAAERVRKIVESV
ncbi:hypothetical protein BDW75DRAFT_243734 [Aspergillus navahoensis]